MKAKHKKPVSKGKSNDNNKKAKVRKISKAEADKLKGGLTWCDGGGCVKS